MCALSYLSVDRSVVQCRDRLLGKSATQNHQLNARRIPRRAWFQCSFHFQAESYGAILSLLGIIKTASSCLLPPAIKRPVRRRYAMTMQTKLIFMSSASKAAMNSSSFVQLYQKKRQKRNSTMMAPIPATGPYCFRSNSQLMRTAARLYFAESSRRRLLMSPILSKLSPR